ncbi:Ig-like domain-containing protein [Stigmatella sp. ncwal1]|uniref:Ig-like domain-containing protein n=1 Tax=Stigmatella ashevillensis TaxID=2995309 RepID=A0ABT5D6A8_9BACT|nr:Ig-like domain-containing protein [Stigmatella ashevillena]MDC0709181.1 Ig-like domain-containing protein [Stigmatella ashevillena]
MRPLVALLVAGLVLISCEALADTATPTLTLYLPNQGPSSPTVTGTVTIRVTGTNLTQMTQYEVFLDGHRLTDGYLSYPYDSRESSWNTRTVANGSHTLLGQLKDSSGNVISSTVMNVTIDQDLIAPTVSVLTPADGVTVHETVNVQGTASDDRGVSMVRALVDGVVLNVDFSAPYSFDSLYVKSLSNGPHTLTLEAWDFSQNVTVSAPITLFLDNDNTVPNVVLTAPASGTVVPGGPVSLTADASDDRGIKRVAFFLNSALIAEDTTAPYGVEWISDFVLSGDYTLTAKAYDLAGNVTESAPVAITVFKPGTAVFDPVLRAPVCDTVGSFCDTAKLVEGRNTSEVHAPNTIDGCLDASGLDQVYSERIQRITVTRVGGEFLAGNRRARIDVLVYGDTVATDALDLYSASDATRPSWTYLTTVPAAIYGAHWLSAEVVLPAGNLQAVRAQFRVGSANSSASPCSVGARDDHDDLVFAVGPPTDAFPPTVKLLTPHDNAPYSHALVGGQVRVSASAEDDLAVERVEFFADGTLIGTDTSEPYEVLWNSSAVADGSHSLTAKAFDPAGRSTTSHAVVVTTDNTGPSATLLSPTHGALLRGNVVLDATASDPNDVTRVDYYSGQSLLGAYPVSPQTSHAATWYTWSVPDGVHRLTARARDSLGNVGISAEVVVTIDNTPPSAEFTAPQAYATLRGILPVSATAQDANGVAKVEFYAGDQLMGTATTAPYTVSWDSRAGPNGHISLTTRAYDTAGNVQVSSSHPVSVDNSAPTVALTSPSNGASLFLSTTLQASAADNVGVTQVVFYDGATVIGTDTSAPYSVSWSLLFVPKGTHTLTAKAFDAVGNVTSSAPVTVKVN